MRTPISSAVLVAFALAIAGCGSTTAKGTLSQSQSSTMNSALNDVDMAVAAGDCIATGEASAHLQDVVAGLPSSVDSGLKTNLTEAANRVAEQGRLDCVKTTTTTSSSTTTTTTPTTTSSSSTSTTSSSTTTTPTTTSTTTTTTMPPDGGGATP